MNHLLQPKILAKDKQTPRRAQGGQKGTSRLTCGCTVLDRENISSGPSATSPAGRERLSVHGWAGRRRALLGRPFLPAPRWPCPSLWLGTENGLSPA